MGSQDDATKVANRRRGGEEGWREGGGAEGTKLGISKATDERQAGRKEGRKEPERRGREAGAAIAIAAAVVTATASIHVLDYNVVVAAAFPPCANEHYPTGRGPWAGGVPELWSVGVHSGLVSRVIGSGHHRV